MYSPQLMTKLALSHMDAACIWCVDMHEFHLHEEFMHAW